MINAKVKIIYAEYPFNLEKEINEFLQTIDVRQIIKTEYSSASNNSSYKYSVIIYYVDLADVRDAKIENVLEIK